jgi:enoyl-CoA hydratase/carnithine racemase
MSDRVSIAIDAEGIADVRLNRPDKLNACDLELIEALGSAGSELAKSRSLRAGGGPPDAIRAAKRLLGESEQGAIQDRLALEARLQRPLIGGPNQIEAVRANLERRPPRFQDPN